MAKGLKSRHDKAEESVGFLLWKASNKLQRLHRVGLKELGLTPTQFSILASIVYISAQENSLSQKALCEHTQIDKMLVSDVVKALLKKEYVTKEVNPDDSRSFLISPTQLGRELANKAVKIVEDMDDAYFATVMQPEIFKRNLQKLLE